MGQQLVSNGNILMQRERQTFEPSAHKCLALPDSLCHQKGSLQRDRQATSPLMLRIKMLGQQDTETGLSWGDYPLYRVCSLAGFVKKICRCSWNLDLGTFCTVGGLDPQGCFSGTGEQKDTSGPQTGTDIWYSFVDAWRKILFDSKIRLQSSNSTSWIYLTYIHQKTLILKEYTYAKLVKYLPLCLILFFFSVSTHQIIPVI